LRDGPAVARLQGHRRPRPPALAHAHGPAHGTGLALPIVERPQRAALRKEGRSVMDSPGSYLAVALVLVFLVFLFGI
jgi:hypothetical protein